jgi:hypothetical protein
MKKKITSRHNMQREKTQAKKRQQALCQRDWTNGRGKGEGKEKEMEEGQGREKT